jgi:hypothetical protein
MLHFIADGLVELTLCSGLWDLPDLIACDFQLQEMAKDHIYVTKPHNLDRKQCIRDVIVIILLSQHLITFLSASRTKGNKMEQYIHKLHL